MGEREEYLQNASELLAVEIGVIQKESKIYESVPWGVENQSNYLNQVLEIKSEFSWFLKRLERKRIWSAFESFWCFLDPKTSKTVLVEHEIVDPRNSVT